MSNYILGHHAYGKVKRLNDSWLFRGDYHLELFDVRLIVEDRITKKRFIVESTETDPAITTTAYNDEGDTLVEINILNETEGVGDICYGEVNEGDHNFGMEFYSGNVIDVSYQGIWSIQPRLGEAKRIWLPS